jgi:hypothetical protein
MFMYTAYPHYTLLTETPFLCFSLLVYLRAAWWSSKIQAPYFGEDDNRVCMAAGVVKVRKSALQFYIWRKLAKIM